MRPRGGPISCTGRSHPGGKWHTFSALEVTAHFGRRWLAQHPHFWPLRHSGMTPPSWVAILEIGLGLPPVPFEDAFRGLVTGGYFGPLPAGRCSA